MKEEHENILQNGFKTTQMQNGYEIINLEEDVPLDDILSYVFYNKTVHIASDGKSRLQSIEANRFDDLPQCFICGDKGHMIKECPKADNRKCFFCGDVHVGSVCKSVICTNCFRFGHMSNKCRLNQRYRENNTGNYDRDGNRNEYLNRNNNFLPNERPFYHQRAWRTYKLIRTPSFKSKVNCAYCHGGKHWHGECHDCSDLTQLPSPFGKNFKNLVEGSLEKKQYGK